MASGSGVADGAAALGAVVAVGAASGAAAAQPLTAAQRGCEDEDRGETVKGADHAGLLRGGGGMQEVQEGVVQTPVGGE